ncbi:MAG: hypothetical protein ACREH8_01230 [Opitutaceae bacterium]
MPKSTSRARSDERPNPAVVALRVEVPRMVYRRAVRLTGAYASMSLGEVLEHWIGDAAHGATHLDSWEHKQLTKWLRGHPFPAETRPRAKHRAVKRAPEVL